MKNIKLNLTLILLGLLSIASGIINADEKLSLNMLVRKTNIYCMFFEIFITFTKRLQIHFFYSHT